MYDQYILTKRNIRFSYYSINDQTYTYKLIFKFYFSIAAAFLNLYLYLCRKSETTAKFLSDFFVKSCTANYFHDLIANSVKLH